MTRNMLNLGDIYDSFNNSSFLEDNRDSEFLEWYNLEGSERIKELSRQLRTFLNYKSKITRLRFLRFKMYYKTLERNSISKREEELTSLYTRYSNNLLMIGIEDEAIAEKIRKLLQKAIIQPNNHEITLLKEIKHLGSKMWKILHILSEYELNLHPQVLHTAIKIACVLSSTEGLFFPLFSDFYAELKLSYLLLEKELSKLPQLNNTRQFKENERKKMVRILE